MKDSVNVRKSCILCNGPPFRNFKNLPTTYPWNKKYSEFKCRNHLTIGEARRLYAQSSKTNYSDAKLKSTRLLQTLKR
ncbi:hypothetical protein CEXT_303031 [Caerostris extrusa]|uniref:Uncharacterized protein n=1 Tax=Caerostris extrusa TaxID=172846 RepID=A0AAV4SLC3_CAEEX|nr:hypothetical protein CEXT_303031 [Caerostris extrusa]